MGRVYAIPLAAVWTFSVCPFYCQQYEYGRAGYPFFKCWNVGLSGLLSVRCQTEQKCQNRNQSGTGIGDTVWNRNAPVPDWNTVCRNADAGGIDLDADAQLCKNKNFHAQNWSINMNTGHKFWYWMGWAEKGGPRGHVLYELWIEIIFWGVLFFTMLPSFLSGS